MEEHTHVQQEVEALAAMIVNNPILLRLQLARTMYSAKQWTNTIFPALASNRKLKQLGIIEGRLGVDSEHGVFGAMLSMLGRNTTLRMIDLREMSLQPKGKDAAIEAQLKRNREYRAALAGLPTVPMKSCRLILCGHPFVGKSTLREAICKGWPPPKRYAWKSSICKTWQSMCGILQPIQIIMPSMTLFFLLSTALPSFFLPTTRSSTFPT